MLIKEQQGKGVNLVDELDREGVENGEEDVGEQGEKVTIIFDESYDEKVNKVVMTVKGVQMAGHSRGMSDRQGLSK